MIATEPAPLPPSGPDRLFRVGPLRSAGGTTVEASMRCGPWTAGPDGRPGLGSLCVLLDAVLGQATIAGRPEGFWPVTTEMTVDLTGPVPDDGDVTVRAWVIGSGGHSVVARGDVLGPDGTLIGVATEWGRLVPDVPDIPADDPGSDVVPPDGDAAAVLGAYVVVGAPTWAAGE
ncbi:MAG: PaaI family thioesterase, partial [Actinomycetota bacterium]|nr:PaaI family thioesterase [Actinomycetota bacterium]